MLSRFVAFTSLGRKALPNQYDLFAFALIFSAFIAVTHVSHGVTLPLTAPESTVVSLDYLLLLSLIHISAGGARPEPQPAR